MYHASPLSGSSARIWLRRVSAMSSDENADIRELRGLLDEAKEAQEAIYQGAVDAVVVMGLNGPQIFTLKNADEPYRILVERMNEGALKLSPCMAAPILAS